MAVKIKLKRMGKIREPYYRIVVADARTKRDGRAIEEIGKYHPKADPSFIEVNSDRAQHWLAVGAQPTDPVRKLLEITGDWQRFKGLPGAEGTLKTAAPRSDKQEIFAAALAETLVESGATTKGKGRAGAARSGDQKAGDAKAGTGKSGEAKAGEGKAGDGKADKPARTGAKAKAAKADADTAPEAAAAEATPADAAPADAAPAEAGSTETEASADSAADAATQSAPDAEASAPADAEGSAAAESASEG